MITNTCRWLRQSPECHVILTSRGIPDKVSEEPDFKARGP